MRETEKLAKVLDWQVNRIRSNSIVLQLMVPNMNKILTDFTIEYDPKTLEHYTLGPDGKRFNNVAHLARYYYKVKGISTSDVFGFITYKGASLRYLLGISSLDEELRTLYSTPNKKYKNKKRKKK